MNRGTLYGLKKSRRSPYVNWALDVDYAHKLGPTEQAWLSQFLNEYYLSGSRSPKNVHDDDGLRRCWKEYKRCQRAECIMSYRDEYRRRAEEGERALEEAVGDPRPEDRAAGRVDNQRAEARRAKHRRSAFSIGRGGGR